MFVVVTHKTAGEPTVRSDRETAEDVDLIVVEIRARARGFYMNRTRTYFVAQDGAVYLVRAPGQPATLQREDDLPPNCDPSVVLDEVLTLLGEAADMAGRRGLGQRNAPARHPPGRHPMTPHDRRAARYAEIERDHQVVVAALVAGLRRIARDTEAEADPEDVCQRVEDTVAESRAAYRRLNDARINLRGQRNAQWNDSQGLPAPLIWYRHHGNYHGEFASMAALGVLLSQTWSVGDDLADRDDAASVAEELHLRGELWTFVHDGALHVFSKPASPSDAALAHPRAPDGYPRHTPLPDPRLAERGSLTLTATSTTSRKRASS